MLWGRVNQYNFIVDSTVPGELCVTRICQRTFGIRR
jgi:hypothetical protein